MNKTLVFIGIGTLIIIIITGILLFIVGPAGLWQILKTIIIIIFILAFIIMAAWIVYYFIIKKHKFDATAVNKKKLAIAGRLQCPNQIRNRTLRMSGDKGHSYIDFGKIIGFLQIQVLTREKVLDEQGNEINDIIDGEKKAIYKITNSPQDIFVISTAKNFITKLFEDPKVVRVDPKDHDNLIGDVTLFGLNLIPLSEYYYLNTDYLDTRKIDAAILNEAERGIMFEMLKDVKQITDMAINLDARHRKDIEQKNLLEIPQLQQMGVQGKQ